jgi:hypothetical protein
MTPCLRERLFTPRDRLFGEVTPEPRETPTPLRPSVTARFVAPATTGDRGLDTKRTRSVTPSACVRGQVEDVGTRQNQRAGTSHDGIERIARFDIGSSAQGHGSNRGIEVPVTSPKCRVRASCP